MSAQHLEIAVACVFLAICAGGGLLAAISHMNADTRER